MSKKDTENVCPGLEMRCPGCSRPLRIPRIRGDQDEKPLICGGCGQRFDCRDLEGEAPHSGD
jgi:hypothetical protein